MRGMSVITLALALCLSITAQAQKGKKPKKGTAKPAQIQKAAANMETAETSTALSIAPAPSESTSTATLQTDVAAKKSPFSFSVLTFHDVGKGSIHNSDPSAYGIWRPAVRYALTDRLTLSYTQEFQNYYANTKANARWQINDGRVQLLNSKIATLPGDINVDGFIRAYVPTGESTRFKTKRHTALYGNLNASKQLGKFGLSYSFLAWYSVNSQDYYLNLNSSTGQMTPQANVDFILENYMGADFAISPKLSTSITTGIIDTYFRGIPVKGVARDTALYTEIGLSYKAVKNVSIGTSIFNQTSLQPNNDFKYFADADTYYRALVNVSL